MAKRKFRNFDQMVEERRAIAPEFTLFGNTYKLSPTLRYDALLQLNLLAKRQKDEVVNDDETFAVFESVLGPDILDELRTYTDFDVELAAEIVRWALEQYGIGAKEDEINDPKEQE